MQALLLQDLTYFYYFFEDAYGLTDIRGQSGERCLSRLADMAAG